MCSQQILPTFCIGNYKLMGCVRVSATARTGLCTTIDRTCPRDAHTRVSQHILDCSQQLFSTAAFDRWHYLECVLGEANAPDLCNIKPNATEFPDLR